MNISQANDVTIRQLLETDVEQFRELTTKVKWNDTANDLRELIRFCPKTAFALTKGQAIIGAALALPYENRMRISYVCVDPDYAGKGYGRRIMNHLLANIDKSKVVELDSSTDGARLYPNLGFSYNPAYDVQAMELASDREIEQIQSPHKIGSEDIRALIELDKHAFGSSREMFIRNAVSDVTKHIVIDKEEEKIVGFAICSQERTAVRIGPWIHKHEAGAEKLLSIAINACRTKFGQVSITINTAHKKAIELLKNKGFTPTFTLQHMNLEKVQPQQGNRDNYYAFWSVGLA